MMDRKGSVEHDKQRLREVDLRNASTLRTILRKAKIRLIKASWLVEHASKGTLASLNRQSLEEMHPEAFADKDMTERCLREVEVSSDKTWCAYPALVLLSYCWQTSQHPDPFGSLVNVVSVNLNWYAAQRARYTKERIYWGNNMQGFDFDLDFCVFFDFWSVFQHPRTPEQGGNYLFAKKWMNVLYGHRSTTVLVISEVPEDVKASAEFAERGGYHQRGWCVFEFRVASLCKIPGQCLDMAGFGDMLARFDASGERRKAFKTPFSRAREGQLRIWALDDRNGTVEPASCLAPMVRGRMPPPTSPTDLEKSMIFLQWSNKADVTVCSEGYQDAAAAVFAQQAKMSLNAMHKWGAEEWKQLGGVMLMCSQLTDLWLQDCSLGDDGMAAFAEALHRSCAPQLEVMHLGGSGVGEAGCVALVRAVERGAMPGLRMVAGLKGGVRQAEVAAEAGTTMEVAMSGETMELLRARPKSVLDGGPRRKLSGLSTLETGFTPERSVLISRDGSPPAGAADGEGVLLTDVGIADQLTDVGIADHAAAEGWDLLKPPPGRSRSASPPGSGRGEPWVDMAIDRPTQMATRSARCGCSLC